MHASADVAELAGDVGLDLHEGLCTVGGQKCCRTGALWLLNGRTGELVKPRCKSPNKCEVCAVLVAVENSEMLALDACEGDPPTLVAILTTRTATLDMAAFYRARGFVLRALRRRWSAAEYACLLEFTTGYGPRSGGKRRPHWNLLLKGIPAEAADQAREVVARTWARNVDAEAGVQYVESIENAQALMRYVAQHFQKESQTPPRGFTGQRFNCSRGYFTGMTRAEARARAQASLRRKRAIWRATRPDTPSESVSHRVSEVSAHDAELVAELAERDRAIDIWQRIVWKPGERPQAPMREATRLAARTGYGRRTARSTPEADAGSATGVARRAPSTAPPIAASTGGRGP